MTLPVQTCLLIGILGNLIYALSGLLVTVSPQVALWSVVVGRVLSGAGAGEFITLLILKKVSYRREAKPMSHNNCGHTFLCRYLVLEKIQIKSRKISR